MQQRLWSRQIAAGLVGWALLGMATHGYASAAETAPLASAATTSSSSEGQPRSHGSAGSSKADPASGAAEPAIGAGGSGGSVSQKLTSGRDLAETVLADDRFTTLAQALRTAGMLPLLKSKGPYTFFAPTDDGWKKMPSDARQKLLADPARLKAVLLYHILRARVDNVGLHKLRNALTMGGIVNIDYTSGVKVNGFVVSDADIGCKNGIIHAVDGVLQPSQRLSQKALLGKAGAAKKAAAEKAKDEPAEQ